MYYKIVQDKEDLVIDYLIVITWVAEYKKNVQKHCKCVCLEGEITDVDTIT